MHLVHPSHSYWASTTCRMLCSQVTEIETVSVSSNSQWHDRQASTAGHPPSPTSILAPFHWLFLHAAGVSFSKGKSFHVFFLFLGKTLKLSMWSSRPCRLWLWPLFQPHLTLLFSQSLCFCHSVPHHRILLPSTGPCAHAASSVCNSASHPIPSPHTLSD